MSLNELRKRAERIKLLICDVDGVLTDGQLHYDDRGIFFKSFHVHDGMGLQLLMHLSVKVAIITTCTSDIIKTRAEQLRISDFYQGIRDKLQPYHELIARYDLQHSDIAYVGDDLPDLPLIESVGLGVAVANAHFLLKQKAHFVTSRPGGNGAVREVCDLILESKQGMSNAFDLWRENR